MPCELSGVDDLVLLILWGMCVDMMNEACRRPRTVPQYQ